MGRMFDSSEKLKTTFLKPPKHRGADGCKSGPIQDHYSQKPKKKYEDLGTKKNKQDKSSFWKWSTSLFHKGFNCIFSIHVHCIQNLPIFFLQGTLLEVHCTRKGKVSRTLASRVLNGCAQFEETLQLPSKVRASKQHPHTIRHPVSKSFRLSVVSVSEQLVLGEITLDLGSILPNAVGDTVDHASTCAWTSAFKLMGSEKLKGASVVASIGYEFPSPESSKYRSESCRFSVEDSQQPNNPSFWRRLRPLSGFINVSSVTYQRSESMRSMPDLTGLTQDACSSSCSDNEEELEMDRIRDIEGLGNGSDRRLDSMLCSLVKAQTESGEGEKVFLPEPVELSKDEFSVDYSTAYFSSEEDADFSGDTEKSVKDVRVSEEKQDHLDIYDEADTVTRQFLRMLEAEEHEHHEDALEPLGSPVYEANWMLAPIPEEVDEQEVCIPLAAPVPDLRLSLYKSGTDSGGLYKPEVDAVDLRAFVPTWRKEDDLDLACIMEAAEFELQKMTKAAKWEIEERARENKHLQRNGKLPESISSSKEHQALMVINNNSLWSVPAWS